MKWKSTIALSVACLALTAFYVYSRLHLASTEETTFTKKRVFQQRLIARHVRRVEITRHVDGKAERLVFGRKGKAHWNLVEPISDWADRFVVNDLIAKLDGLEAKRRKTAEDLAPFGLDEPVGRIRLVFAKDRKREPETLLVGSKALSDSPDAGNVYVKLEAADSVAAADASILDEIGKDLSEYRSKDAFLFETYRVNKLELTYPKRSVTCVKSEDRWRISSPIAVRADGAAVATVIDTIRMATRETFVNDNIDQTGLAPYGLDMPRVRATVWTKPEDEKHELLIGIPVDDESGNVYAKTNRNDTIFTVKLKLLTDLVQRLNDLRDPAVARFDPDKALKLRLATSETTIVLSRPDKETPWRMTSPKTRKAHNRDINALLRAVAQLEVDSWPDMAAGDLQQFGLDDPAATLTIELPESSTTIIVGKTTGEHCFIKRADEPSVMRVPLEVHTVLTRGYLAYVSRRVLDFPKRDAVSLTINRDGKRIVCSLENGRWQLTEPEGALANSRTIDDILWRMSALDAAKIVAEDVTDFAPYGLEDPAITAVVKLKDAGRKKLLLGKPAPKNRVFGTVKGTGMVFTIAERLSELLSSELQPQN